MTAESTVDVRVTHRFTASAERVFDAWVNPDSAHRWWASFDEVVRIEVDARVGGGYSFVVRREGEEIDHHGEYLELDRPRRLVFTWLVDDEEGPSIVTIDITSLDDGCELSLVHTMDARWADYVAQTEHGWSTICGAISSSLE